MDNLIVQQLDNGCVNIMCLLINIMEQLKVMFMDVSTQCDKSFFPHISFKSQ